MVIRRHGFSDRFIATVQENVGLDAEQVIAASDLLQYLHNDMKAAERGSKARYCLANIYAIYAAVEDYRNKVENPDEQLEQIEIELARYTDLKNRACSLYGGAKLQNHGFNHRLENKFTARHGGEIGPLIRHHPNYTINQDLLIVEVEGEVLNISAAVIAVVEEYICALREKFLEFIENIERVVNENDLEGAREIVSENIADNSDARQFEITSFSIMHCFYSLRSVYIGNNREQLEEVAWTLYKTGRTNANDGGIDFVLQPLGRFYQVTEDVNVAKWFLDIDKVARYPITFVVKDSRTPEDILQAMREDALGRDEFSDEDVDNMIECIDEIVNVPNLIEMFNHCTENGLLECIMDQILEQSRVEFNIED